MRSRCALNLPSRDLSRRNGREHQQPERPIPLFFADRIAGSDRRRDRQHERDGPMYDTQDRGAIIDHPWRARKPERQKSQREQTVNKARKVCAALSALHLQFAPDKRKGQHNH